jgi:hypothetical protein
MDAPKRNVGGLVGAANEKRLYLADIRIRGRDLDKGFTGSLYSGMK